MILSINAEKIFDTSVVLCQINTPPFSSDETVVELWKYLNQKRGFTGKYKEFEELDFAGFKTPEKYIFAGLGKDSDIILNSYRKLFGMIGTRAYKNKSKHVTIDVTQITEGVEGEELYKIILEVVEGFLLSIYRYDKHLSVKKVKTIESINFIVSETKADIVSSFIEEAQMLAESTYFSRDLTNEPSNHQTPEMYAQVIKNAVKDLDIECSIYDELYIEEIGMKAVIAVGKASPNPPRLIVLRYKGNPDSEENIGLIGKGLTFDSGGLSLKNKGRLSHMKHDMAGSAAVFGAITAIAKKKLKINVTVVVAAIENLLSGKGYKPGDIIGSMGGKSILITSTDGEGRLALSDSIVYAVKKEKITCAFDIATLTGGARQIFGGYINPVLSNDERLYGILEKASTFSGEEVHRMPLLPEAREVLKSDIADIRNSSGIGYFSMIQGGMFIYEFVGNLPWVHTDMSGSGLADFKTEYVPAGGTGRGVRNLYHVVRCLSQE